MDSDLSLIEISDEDDSLLRLQDPSDAIFPCSQVETVKSTQMDAAPDSSSVGGVRNVRFTEKFGERSSKENIYVKMEGMKLNMDPLQMKRRKKDGGYNMRKSLAWNKAFSTEEGVLDPEELSLVTGTFNLSSEEPLSVIQEEKRKPGRNCSSQIQSPKEKLFIKSPGLGRGLSPRCDSSTRYRVSPAKEIGSPHVRHLVLSAHDTNRKGEKHNGCPRPTPSSSPAASSSSNATSKEPKLTKSSVPRAERCSLPMVPRSALPKANCLSKIPGADAKRVISAQKSAAVALKGSMTNNRCVKRNITNVGGLKGFAKSVSSDKTPPFKESAQLPGRIKSKLPPKVPTPKDPQVPLVSELDRAPYGVPDQVQQHHRGNNKHNYIPLPQKCLPNDSQKQVPHVQVGKPTGLRVPSPSLGFFGQPKQSASLGNTHLRDIPDSSAYSYYAGVRNLFVAQRPLQATGNVLGMGILPGVSNGILASDELRCFSSNTREPLLTDKPVEIGKSTKASNSSPVVQADFLEKHSQTLCDDVARVGQTPSASNKYDEREDMKPLHTYDSLQDINRSYYAQPKCNEHQENINNSCGKEPIDSLSQEGYSVSEAENQDCSGIQPMTYDNRRSTHDSDQPSVEGTETRKPDYSEAQLKRCKESLDGQMNYDASSPQLKCGGNQGMVSAAFKEDLKDSLSLEDYSFCVAETQDSSDLIRRFAHDNEKSLHESDQQSVERTETRNSVCSEAHQEKFKESRDRGTIYDPSSPQDKSAVLDVKEHGQKQSSCVEVELLADCKTLSLGSQTESEHLVKHMHQIFLECHIQLPENNKDNLVEIFADLDEMANKGILSYDQNDEMLQQSSKQITEVREAGSDRFLEEIKTTESRNYPDLVLLHLKSTVDHEVDCSLDATNESEGVDGDELRNPSSQLADLQEVNVVCKADAYTTKNHAESLSSDKCSLSETFHQDNSEDQYGMPDIGLVAVSQNSREKERFPRSTNLDVGKLERNVTETTTSEDDTTGNVVEHIQEGTSSNPEESDVQLPRSIRSNSKPVSIVMKPPPNAVPFSDEWLAAIEAAGEDILTLKSGAVQHSPPDKSIPKPSPWSPVKRNKNQGIGPFDCTKHTNLLNADD